MSSITNSDGIVRREEILFLNFQPEIGRAKDKAIERANPN